MFSEVQSANGRSFAVCVAGCQLLSNGNRIEVMSKLVLVLTAKRWKGLAFGTTLA